MKAGALAIGGRRYFLTLKVLKQEEAEAQEPQAEAICAEAEVYEPQPRVMRVMQKKA